MANTRVNWNRFFAYKNMPKRSVWIGICRICGKDVCRPNWGTSGMKDHMERKHPNELQGAAGPVPADPQSPLLTAPLTLVAISTPDKVLPKKYTVQTIVAHRWNMKKGRGNKGRIEYRVRWADKYNHARHDTWEPYGHFETAMHALNDYIRFGLNLE